MMECGLVGLPNVGKSTLFNALTATALAQAANYPFCTVEPNRGSVLVPDDRLKVLAALASSKAILPTHLTFVDIAGLVKGASTGEGLGNQFLGHVREVSAILHVVRCFEDTNIVHVEGAVNPLQDMAIIETELMLADLQSIEKRLHTRKKGPLPGQVDVAPLLQKAQEVLNQGIVARKALWSQEEMLLVPKLGLLTTRPMVYVCNVAEEEGPSPLVEAVTQYAQEQDCPVVTICARLEAELAHFSPQERLDFLQSSHITQTGLDKVVSQVYQHLGLITFFTVGPQETRAWTIPQGSTAWEAAGVIHTDFQKGFIRAETIAFQDYVTYKTPADIKLAGRLRSEGRDYVVQDGDVLLFRFNV